MLLWSAKLTNDQIVFPPHNYNLVSVISAEQNTVTSK
uniref:Uncharacterized protein n=1 Tax=Anguilla anguilla TaxID=7936 RepID=A0A0E9XAH1_ANGAN